MAAVWSPFTCARLPGGLCCFYGAVVAPLLNAFLALCMGLNTMHPGDFSGPSERCFPCRRRRPLLFTYEQIISFGGKPHLRRMARVSSLSKKLMEIHSKHEGRLCVPPFRTVCPFKPVEEQHGDRKEEGEERVESGF